MKKPVIILDIDYTIFNTTTFRANAYEQLAIKLGFTDLLTFFNLAKTLEKATKEQAGYFKPQLFLQLLKENTKTSLSQKELEDIFFDESLYIESLYEDARELFQELVTERDIPVIIFSTGEKKFQSQKLTAFKDILKEDHVHIFADKLLQLKEVLKKYEDNQIYLVDDLPTILKEAKHLDNSIQTIWVNRDKKLSEKDFVPDFTADFVIENLVDLVKIITKN